MEQLKMFNGIDKYTLAEVIKHIEKTYIEKPQGRLLRVSAEMIVEDLREWVK